MTTAEGRRIFVVDDEKVIAYTLAVILNQSGFNAEAFSSPVEALEALHADPPDLVLSDVMMPEMNGVELAVAMRLKCPACKVLLFSGQAATSDLLESARSDGHDFVLLHKPVHPVDLLAAIRQSTGVSNA